MYNMGIGGSDHDLSICITKDERVLVAIDEERISRFKYGIGSDYLKGLSRKYCLNSHGLLMENMRHIVGTDILIPHAYFSFRNKISLINHHMAHASSSFYPSSFQKAAILVVDNGGSMCCADNKTGIETISYYFGEESQIFNISKVLGTNWNQIKGDSDHSLGHFYKIISKTLGFTYIMNDTGMYKGLCFTEDGKTMGLASYGTDRYLPTLLDFLKLLPEGQVWLQLHDHELESVIEEILNKENHSFQSKADIAYAGQKILEIGLIHCANYLYKQTKCENLCIAGGVGLNSVANGQILSKTNFRNIFIQPAAGDNGTALGCAMYAYYVMEGKPRTTEAVISNVYFGRTYAQDDIQHAVESIREPGIIVKQVDDITKATAEKLVQQHIVGWYQGGAEYGPRALGHRSILVDPRNPDMKDTLNNRVKKRESFRPFAPAILREHLSEYFCLDIDSPYMLLVCDVLEDKRSVIPSVTHIDGTARVQTVTKRDNGIFYDLIQAFANKTGVPILLNTSFNIKGEPIVETPEDAIRCFLNTDIDCLVMGHYIIEKRSNKNGI